jgi:hypothetical protein
VAFKATSSKSKGKKKQESPSEEEESSTCDEDDGDEFSALFVKVGKLLRKKSYCGRRKKTSSKKSEHSMKCFRCHSKDHLIAKCPYDSGDEDAINKERKK